jgi:hypothetical protein
MSKVKNETVGHVVCPFSGITSDVRRTSPGKKGQGGKYYYVNSAVGIVNPHGAKFQEWMNEHAKFSATSAPVKPGTADKPSPVDAGPAPVVPCEKKSPPQPAREKSGGMFGAVSRFLNEDV